MRLVTYQRMGDATPAGTRVGALRGEHVADLAQARGLRGGGGAPFPDSMLELLRLEDRGMEDARAAEAFAFDSGDALEPLGSLALRAPLPRPNSIRDFFLVEEHATAGGTRTLPPAWYELPVYWKGNPDAVFGPEDDIRWPSYTEKLDYELEIAAVIGRRGHRLPASVAPGYIAGYTIFNDWSARDIQRREMTVGLGPGLGKDFATSIGPCIVTPDEFAGAAARMTARVNGELWSDGNLGAMRVSFPELVSHLSVEQELHPGDLLGSGTIGKGCGLELDRWIQPGDVVELEVEGIGVLRNVVTPPVPWDAAG